MSHEVLKLNWMFLHFLQRADTLDRLGSTGSFIKQRVSMRSCLVCQPSITLIKLGKLFLANSVHAKILYFDNKLP